MKCNHCNSEFESDKELITHNVAVHNPRKALKDLVRYNLLWTSLILLWIFGDVITTHIGLSLGAIETNGIMADLMAFNYPVAMFIAILGKALGIYLAYLGYWFLNMTKFRRYSKYYPIALLIISLIVVGNNIRVILLLL